MTTKSIRFRNWKCVPLIYDSSFHSIAGVSLSGCVCTYMFVCEHMYVIDMCAGVCTCVGVYDQNVSPSIFLHLFSEIGSFTDPGTQQY